MSFRAPAFLVALAAGSLLLAGTAQAAPSASTGQVKVDGYLIGYPGDCGDTAPAAPLVCHEWVLNAYRHNGSSWQLLALRHTLTFPGAGADPDESDVAFAFVDGADVSFDRQHLSSATVRAHGLSLSDGSTVDLDATWTAVTDRLVAGNDGPALGEYDLVRHVHEDCLTANNQVHQKLRNARVDAVIDGVPSVYDGAFAFISLNQFISVEVHARACA